MRFLVCERMIQFRSGKRGFGLRIGNIRMRSKARELGFASAPNSLGEFRIAMTCEVQKRGGFTVFFAHKEKRNERRQDCNTRRQFQAFEANQATESLTQGSIANLIVVLITDH